MTREERAFVHGLIRSRLERVTGAPHFYDRATERTFTLSDAVRTLRCGLVVEVHNNTPGDIRALVRDSLGTCAVVSLRSWQIVTVYYNAPEDPHNTLDWTPYRWRTNLVELVKELPDAEVRSVIEWIASDLGISAFDIECRSSSATIVGRAYTQGSAYHSSSRPFAVLRVGSETVDRWQASDGFGIAWASRRSFLLKWKTPIAKVSTHRFPATITPYQYAHHKGKRYALCTRLEALVYITAHELRHLWQAAQSSDKRKSANLPRYFGSRGKFSEIDTESYAIHMLRAWRKRIA